MAKTVISSQHTIQDGLTALAQSQSHNAYKQNRNAFTKGKTFQLVGHTHVFFTLSKVTVEVAEQMEKNKAALSAAYEAYEKLKNAPQSAKKANALSSLNAAVKEFEKFCEEHKFQSYEAIETSLVTKAGTPALIPIRSHLINGYLQAKAEGQEVSDLQHYDKGDLGRAYDELAEKHGDMSLRDMITLWIKELNKAGKNDFVVSSAEHKPVYNTFKHENEKKFIYTIDFNSNAN